MHKDPKQRLGVKNKDELRKDPFFKDIDWEALEGGSVAPPIILTQDENDSEMDPFEREYLNSNEGVKFKDKDYDDKNKNVNRLKQFTFIKGEVGDQ